MASQSGSGVPIALGLGGIAAVLLAMGLTGNSLGEIFQGDFTKNSSSTAATPTGTSTADIPIPGVPGAVSTASQIQAGSDAPAAIINMINWCNSVAGQYPYAWGGGHGIIGQPSQGTASESGGPEVTGYDCSGAVSGALNAGGFLESPETSGELMTFGTIGVGKYVTVFANPIHTFMRIQGHWFGTGRLGVGGGVDWGNYDPALVAYAIVHPPGY